VSVGWVFVAIRNKVKAVPSWTIEIVVDNDFLGLCSSVFLIERVSKVKEGTHIYAITSSTRFRDCKSECV